MKLYIFFALALNLFLVSPAVSSKANGFIRIQEKLSWVKSVEIENPNLKVEIWEVEPKARFTVIQTNKSNAIHRKKLSKVKTRFGSCSIEDKLVKNTHEQKITKEWFCIKGNKRVFFKVSHFGTKGEASRLFNKMFEEYIK